MGFMDSLAANPSGGIFGQPRRENDNDIFSLVNRMKDREMRDYQEKARFDQDHSLRGEMRMRELFDPNKHKNPQDMNQVIGEPLLAPEQQLQYGLRAKQPEVDIARAELGQKNRFGQQTLDIKDAQQKLNDTRNTQINEDRDLERNRKVDESTKRADENAKKLELAERTLTDRTATSDARLSAYRDRSDAIDERHKLELGQKDSHFNTTSEQNAEKIRILEEQLAQRGTQEVTQEVNEDGTLKKTTTKRGSAAETVRVIGKDGKIRPIPKDKLDDKDKDGTPMWKLAGGG